jgi:hypothetical protein
MLVSCGAVKRLLCPAATCGGQRSSDNFGACIGFGCPSGTALRTVCMVRGWMICQLLGLVGVDGNRRMGVAAQQMWCLHPSCVCTRINMDDISIAVTCCYSLLLQTLMVGGPQLFCSVALCGAAARGARCLRGVHCSSGACIQLSKLSLHLGGRDDGCVCLLQQGSTRHRWRALFTNLASAYMLQLVVVHKRCDLQPCGRCMLLCIACGPRSSLGSLGLACTPSFYAAPCTQAHT